MKENNRQLLKAVLLPGPSGLQAFNAWRSTANLDTLPGEQYALLPLLYERAAGFQVEAPCLGRLKGVYRRTWVANQLAFKALAELANAFTTANIQILVIGGACLAQAYYPQPAARPVHSLEMVLKDAAADAASAAIARLGWQPKPTGSSRLHQKQPTLQFRNRTGQVLQLHRQIFKGAPADETFWGQGQSFTVADMRVPTLAAEDHLLLACLAVYTARLLALVDAAMIIASGKVDWPRFIRQVECFQAHLAVLHVFDLLLACAATCIPSQWLGVLRQTQPGLTARCVHHFKLALPALRSLVARAA